MFIRQANLNIPCFKSSRSHAVKTAKIEFANI